MIAVSRIVIGYSGGIMIPIIIPIEIGL